MVTRIQIRRLASLFIPSTERSSALVDELIGRALAMDNFEQLNQIHPDSKFAPIITPESVSDPLNKVVFGHLFFTLHFFADFGLLVPHHVYLY